LPVHSPDSSSATSRDRAGANRIDFTNARFAATKVVGADGIRTPRIARSRQETKREKYQMASNNQGGRGGSSNERSSGGNSRSGNSHERGFAAMSDSDQREIARKGGEAVSQDRQHMADIGRKGGSASAESRSGASNARSASGSSRSDGSDINASGRERDDQGQFTAGSSSGSSTRSGGMSSSGRSKSDDNC
jgi:hypothetical protein